MLKPGGRFLFVEMLRGACQGTLGIIEQEPGWEVDADQAWKTMFNDPHAIGVAVKVPPAFASTRSARTDGLVHVSCMSRELNRRTMRTCDARVYNRKARCRWESLTARRSWRRGSRGAGAATVNRPCLGSVSMQHEYVYSMQRACVGTV